MRALLLGLCAGFGILFPTTRSLAQMPLAQNWQDMGSAERREAMRNYRRHSELPQETQRDIETRYDRWQALSPDEQSRIRQNYDRLQQFSPAERERFQKRYEKWKERKAPQP